MTELRNNFVKNTSTEIIQDHPAVAYVKPLEMKIADEMQIALPFQSRRYGTMYKQFTVGSVFGYSMRYNDCPMAAYERAKELGHKIYWINSNAVSISTMKKEKEIVPAFDWGDEVEFLGKKFTIEKEFNDNAKLVEVE